MTLRKIGTNFAAMAICSLFSSGLSAQSFSASAITIDIDLVSAGAASNELLIVAAYQAPESAPRIARLRNGTRDARKTLEGKPVPSIILGLVQPGQEANFGIDAVLPETAERFGFSYNDLAARNTMRGEDPEMFKRLVASGVLDPPKTEEEALAVLEKDYARVLQRVSRKEGFSAVDTLLKVALQTELKRLNCYTSSIDGDWGNGSKRSVNRLTDQNKGVKSTGSTAANIELFRTILSQGDAKCKIAAAPVRRKTTTKPRTTTTSTQRATTTQQPARQQPARQQPASSSGGGNVGVGVFR